ncbi:hypothetical protein SELMODRAFT_103907 [Selaginella moellendorffii]|uniref:RING-type domain-containing protein n=1 Tax=Selaginella moellendorffii TaxID=88036 RepID=D8RWS2_SELML|nr:hypothetical protein SELMODRAFT_137185 [Selaginella moellendorffii]EFJ23141.1 hypothetical protein SELMODRAFT_103907 [Selaginella moellendorffii]
MPVSGAPNTGVSTGLRLAFPDDRLSSTAPSGCGKLELNSTTGLSMLVEEIAIELQRQRDEIEQLMRAQVKQMRRAIEEKQQQQSRALLNSVERFVARRLREKDIEMEKINRRNMELEERVKQLTVEARLWQNKAKNGEMMVASLRSNLQQAVALSREQSREGVGDTDADDAESSHPDDAADDHARTYKENKELREKRTCRVCRSNDVCILLLPCRHLCLCKECEARLDTCPLCRHSKNASVQVYMS